MPGRIVIVGPEAGPLRELLEREGYDVVLSDHPPDDSGSTTALYPSGGPRKGRQRPSVLVVDDDAEARAVLAGMIEGAFRPLLARDGLEALQRIQEDPPDLVLSDIVLPGLDGFGVLRELRANARTAGLPVILVSAHADLKRRGLSLGAADCLSKPVDHEELRARIDRALRASLEKRALQSLAATDALTGLGNYRALVLKLDAELKRSSRYGTPIACVAIDMDGLKAINDRFGHDAGNRALELFAKVLKGHIRETDFAARCGGDEFVILLPHAREDEGQATAERIRRALAGVSIKAGSERIPLAASFGVAAAAPGEPGVGRLLKAADAALYVAKRLHRGGIVRASAPPERESGTG